MKDALVSIRTLAILQGMVISFAVIVVTTSSAKAQCVPDTLSVISISGKVVAELNRGETPLDNAVVTLRRGGYGGSVIAKQAVKADGSFSFKVMPGKYQLKVSAPALRNFYLDLQVGRSKLAKDQQEIIVIMGADAAKECSGSYAELRVKKKG
jgi:hypothetical protein